jgi:hypothetical protein
MGGEAVGDRELEQCFEPAGREAKESLINRQSANSENPFLFLFVRGDIPQLLPKH